MPLEKSPVPYWRLSLFYFFYFALLGAWLPYWPLYLQDKGFDAQAIAYLTGIMMATKIVAPNIWGWLAAVSGQRMRVIRYGAFFAFVTFLLVFIEQSFLWLALVIGFYSFFWNAVLAQFEVVTLAHLGTQYQRYSLVRVWGSIGFIVAVLLLGGLFDYIQLQWLLAVLVLLLLGLWLSSLLVKDTSARSDTATTGMPFLRVLKNPSVILFFVACFLMQVSHGPYYTFFSLFLEANGYSRSLTGFLWMLGVLAEVVVFIFMHRLLVLFSLRQVMFASILLAVIRWLLTAYYVESLPVLLFAQCLHAASFGSFHALAVEVIRRWFRDGNEGQGMALYSGLCFGAGGALGAVMSGWIWVYSPAMTFLFAALCCVVAFVASLAIKGKQWSQV
jgi:PPP family 3-phenylpropionic acid transporter